MFTGAVQQFTRSRIWELSRNWQGRKVYVACSGNFTVERILAQREGIGEFHSNDVSIYSCALGSYLSGQHTFEISLRSEAPELAFLRDYLGDPLSILATLMLCTDWFKFYGKPGVFYSRINQTFRRNWQTRHCATFERIKKATEGVRLDSFFAGDCVDFLSKADKDGVVISFPPTYKGGYERLYQRFEEVFDWNRPSYQIFTQERFDTFERELFSFRTWMTLTDYDRESLREYCVGVNQSSLHSKPVYTYCNEGRGKIAFPHQRMGRLPRPVCEGEITGDRALTIRATTGEVMNTLRSLYLNPGISPAAPRYNFLILWDEMIVGAVGVSEASFSGGFCDVYIMSDFAVRPSVHKRLAKLVLAVLLSVEFREWLEQLFGRRLEKIGTTAFTDKPVSMKYRELFELHSRKPGGKGEKGKLNYTAALGRWTLQEGFAWWLKKHARHGLSA